MEKLVLLHSFYHKHQAQTAIGLLEEAGIQAMLQADDAGGFYPHLTLAAGNNRVLVHPDDAERAVEVIRPLLEDFSESEMQPSNRWPWRPSHRRRNRAGTPAAQAGLPVGRPVDHRRAADPVTRL